MVLKEFEITLDLIKSKQLNSIEVVQGDFETNIFNIQLTKDYSPVNLSGTTIEVLFAKSDNTTVMQDMDTGVSIVDAAQGKIKVVLNTNTIAAPGMVYAEVRIKEAGKIATTAKFNFYVRKAIVSNVKSTNEFPILEQLINDVEQLKDDIVNLQIPDGSIKDIKLSNEAGQIKERVSTIQQKVDDLEEEMNAPDYSAPQEVTDSVITLPDDVVEGQFSDIVLKGNTRINLVKSSNMDKDSNSDGLVDDFMLEIGAGVTATKSLDTTEKAQKIEITSNTYETGGTATVFQDINVAPGEVISARVETKVSGNVSAALIFLWFRDSTFLSATTGVSTTSTTMTELKYENQIVPANANKARIFLRVLTGAIGNLGSVWFRKLMVEKSPSVGNYISSGVKSTESVRVKSINKNLLNLVAENIYNAAGYYAPNSEQAKAIIANPANQIINGISYDGYFNNASLVSNVYITDEAISFTSKTSGYGIGIRFKAIPGKTHIRSNSSANNDRTYICFYTKDGTYLSYSNVNTATAPDNAYWGFVLYSHSTSGANITINKPQLKEGSVVTEYEPYTETEAYIDGELRSLPNGVKDEINVNTGELTKRVSDNVSISGTTYAILDTATYTNVDVIKTTAFSNAVAGTTAKDGMTRYYDKNGVELTEIAQADIDNAASVGKYYWHTDKTLWIIVAKGAYADITAARTGLGTTTLNYQLATPIPHEGTSQSLIAYPKGHLIIECVKRVTKSYDNGIIVDTPIETIESVTKVEDGERIPIDLSKVTVAGNKLSFTITGATKNEVYEVIYHYNGVLPTVRFSYPQNVAATIAENTKGVAANSKAINDFIAYQNAVNLQFDLRITALEP